MTILVLDAKQYAALRAQMLGRDTPIPLTPLEPLKRVPWNLRGRYVVSPDGVWTRPIETPAADAPR